MLNKGVGTVEKCKCLVYHYAGGDTPYSCSDFLQEAKLVNISDDGTLTL